MKLFLAAEAKHPESLARLETFVDGFAGKSIAYIPTAANADGWGSWQEGGSWKTVQTLGLDITLLQLEDYHNKDVTEVLAGKDLIWFAGGYPGYLLYWIRRTQLDKSIQSILNQGSIYIGSSAGSMITGENSNLSEWFIGESEPGAAVIPTLSLVNFDIYPHFQDELYEQIKAQYDGNKMYLLKNGEVITVEDDVITVLGEERIVIGTR